MGVDTRGIIRGGSRCGIYFLEHGAAQRPSRVVYDRAGSAMAEIKAGMVLWAELLEGARWFHTSGITPALSRSAAEATVEAARSARSAGAIVSIDLNYRAMLWDWGERPERVMSELLEEADVVVGNEEDADKVFGIRAGGVDVLADNLDSAAYEDVCRQLVARFPRVRSVAFTIRGSVSASENTWTGVLWHEGQLHRGRSYRIAPVVDRVGSGDAFAAGLISGLLRRPDQPQYALDFAVAASCLKHSIAGDFNLVTTDEVERLLEGDSSGRVLR
jgi:2-dehydro-3-deoxygluconokinase